LVATGAGAEARKVMGMTVFSGMLMATVVGIILVPALYVVAVRMGSKKSVSPSPSPVGDAE